jgi:hypothetical protein
VYPAVAWWDPAGGQPILEHPDDCLQQFAAATLDTDWGLRDVANDEPIYNGMSYHQGSVWPLFTGWAALAEYRANQSLAGYRMLTENARMTWLEDLGADTELLSGDFYVPMGRSTSHQLWSSAMVVIPALRGLFGLGVDALTKTITVDPHLPAEWDHARVRNVHIGDQVVDVIFKKTGDELTVALESKGSTAIHLRSTAPGARQVAADRIQIPLPAVQVASLPLHPQAGDRTRIPRIVREEYSHRSLRLTLQGPAGTEVELTILASDHGIRPRSKGGEIAPVSAGPGETAADNSYRMTVPMPPGDGWQTVEADIFW